MSARRLRTYDHRLVQLVQRTRDIGLATRRGVPRSTARGWLRQDRGEVVTDPMLEETPAALHARVVRLERRVRRLGAMLRVVLALLRILRPDLSRLRVPEGSDKLRLLRAIDRARGVRGLQRMLVSIGLSASRLSAWRRAARGCELDDADSCPGFSPHALTLYEIDAIEDMVTAPAYRHVPTGRLTPGAKRALEASLEEAEAMQRPEIGPAHLFLGLLADEQAVGRTLRAAGIDAQTVRDQVASAYGADGSR